ncbi:MAG: insulinase family protein [Elusimicrobia bacterium]|nr:insulinase family protein [Elusimicrobiota bacterium]
MTRFIAAALALSLPVPAAAQGQAAPSAKAVQRLNRAPVSKDVLKVKLPRPAVKTLKNGLTVMVVEQHKLPVVTIALWVKTGALSDPQDMPGLAKFTAELLREGTRSRTSQQLANEVDELGASVEASAPFGQDLTSVSASGLVEDTEKLLELVADVTRNAAFPADELDKYKKRQLAELEQLRANPQFLARERFHAALYKDTAPSRIAPTAASLHAASPDRLRAFRDKAYVPGNAILGVAGDVSLAKVLPMIEKRFGDWSGKGTAPSAPAVPKAGPRRVLIVDRPGSVQTEIVAGNFALTRTSPDYIPLTVANRVLGGGPSARLFLQLREEKGYTYGAYSNFGADLYPGPFSARLAVRNEVTEPALKDLFAEFEKIRDQPVGADELDDARRAIVANFALSLERPATLLSLWMNARYFGLSDDYWDRFAEEIARTTPEQAQKAARTYVDPEHMQLVLVGDAKGIRPLAERYGPNVEVYDVDGKRKDLVDTTP